MEERRNSRRGGEVGYINREVGVQQEWRLVVWAARYWEGRVFRNDTLALFLDFILFFILFLLFEFFTSGAFSSPTTPLP